MKSNKSKKESQQKSVRPKFVEDTHSDPGHPPSDRADSTPGLLAFFLRPNKTAFWVLCGFYLFWLVFLAYVAFVNVSSGNQ